MALCPFATVRLLNPAYGGTLSISRHNRINLHVAAGYGSLFNFFNQPGRASSHFWVAKTGYTEQYQDTDRRAEADLQGNDATISIETESKGEPWTPEQLAAIIRLILWLLDTHPTIPRRLATNSFVGASSWGVSWHRLGIDGNFPAGRYAGRRQLGGGMYYSKATGKTCPVEGPIDQIHDQILPAINGGVVPPVVVVDNPLPPPPPPPPPSWPKIDADGKWGGDTTGRMQDRSGTGRDREISHQRKGKSNENIYSAQFDSTLIGSNLIRWIQRRLTATGHYSGPIDGLIETNTVKALQRYYGATNPDGVVSPESNMVRAAQNELNNRNTFLGL